jgi:hypothetical protein
LEAEPDRCHSLQETLSASRLLICQRPLACRPAGRKLEPSYPASAAQRPETLSSRPSSRPGREGISDPSPYLAEGEMAVVKPEGERFSTDW